MKKLIFAALLFTSCNRIYGDDVASFKAISATGGVILQVNNRFDQDIGCIYGVGDTVIVDEYNWINGYGSSKGKFLLVEKLENK